MRDIDRGDWEPAPMFEVVVLLLGVISLCVLSGLAYWFFRTDIWP